jgi:hypothetical protein
MFWRCYGALNSQMKERAQHAHQMFLDNPAHPSLRFKKLHTNKNLWYVRVSKDHRAVGERFGDTIEWFWIGSHKDFDKLY